MGGNSNEDFGQLYLARAEELLFHNFFQDIQDGQYDRAGQLLGFMERLSLV